MIAPLLLLFFAVICASVVTYGTHPNWAEFGWGLDWIMLTRRLQWPLVAASVFCCVVLLGLITSGKRRAWWMIGLAPVVALFYHRFVSISDNAMGIVENPPFVTVDRATFMREDDMVLGLMFRDEPFALPFAALYAQPVVFCTEREHKLVVFWSAFANRALAFSVSRELKPRDLEIVSVPANGLLLFNRKHGQFIAGMTGVRPGDGARPVGLEQQIRTNKHTWHDWRALHPTTRVMVPRGPLDLLPPRAVEPYFKLPAQSVSSTDTRRVTVVGAGEVLAVDPARLPVEPVNVTVHQTRVLLLLDPATRTLRAFNRQIKGDLFPTFKPHKIARDNTVVMKDGDSDSLWSADGRCVSGELKGERLTPLPVDEDVPLAVLRYWYPELVVWGERDATEMTVSKSP